MTKTDYPYDELYKMTGEVIRKTARLVAFSSFVISHYYLGKIDPLFIHDVLTNKYSSFALIRETLLRVLHRLKYDPKIVKELDSVLQEIGNDRNQFAHEKVLVNPTVAPGTFYFADQKRVPYNEEGKEVKFEHAKFLAKYEKAKQHFDQIHRDLNIQRDNYFLEE